MVSLAELDEFYEVKSFTFESDADSYSADEIDAIRGTVTLKIKRKSNFLRYKSQDFELVTIYGEVAGSFFHAFDAKCTETVRKMLRMSPGTTETFTIKVKGVVPTLHSASEEEVAESRKLVYDALCNGYFGKISMDICFNEGISDGDENEIISD